MTDTWENEGGVVNDPWLDRLNELREKVRVAHHAVLVQETRLEDAKLKLDAAQNEFNKFLDT